MGPTRNQGLNRVNLKITNINQVLNGLKRKINSRMRMMFYLSEIMTSIVILKFFTIFIFRHLHSIITYQ